jgi:hypothetical protein
VSERTKSRLTKADRLALSDAISLLDGLRTLGEHLLPDEREARLRRVNDAIIAVLHPKS